MSISSIFWTSCFDTPCWSCLSFFETVLSLYQDEEYWLRGTISCMRETLESMEILCVRLTAGYQKVGYPLTKHCVKLSTLLKKVAEKDSGAWSRQRMQRSARKHELRSVIVSVHINSPPDGTEGMLDVRVPQRALKRRPCMSRPTTT